MAVILGIPQMLKQFAIDKLTSIPTKIWEIDKQLQEIICCMYGYLKMVQSMTQSTGKFIFFQH